VGYRLRTTRRDEKENKENKEKVTATFDHEKRTTTFDAGVDAASIEQTRIWLAGQITPKKSLPG